MTENSLSQFGQAIVLDPGLGFNLNIRSQEGHPISTLTTFGVIRKGGLQEPQINSIGPPSLRYKCLARRAGESSFSSL